MFNDIVTKIVEFVYGNDMESQRFYIEKICNDVRKMNPDIIYKAKGFYVPNQSYLINILGEDAFERDYGLYVNDDCIWQNKLVLPITNLIGNYVGFVGFDPFNYLASHEGKEIGQYYSYSLKNVFNKSYYLYCLPTTYEQAINNGYLIITDGIFDTLSFAQNNYLAAALLGSTLSEQILAQLRFIKKLIVAVDNDSAGSKLVDKLKIHHDNVFVLKQAQYKDADDILKSKYKKRYLQKLDVLIGQNSIKTLSLFDNDRIIKI